jgi:hypothetical protein
LKTGNKTSNCQHSKLEVKLASWLNSNWSFLSFLSNIEVLPKHIGLSDIQINVKCFRQLSLLKQRKGNIWSFTLCKRISISSVILTLYQLKAIQLTNKSGQHAVKRLTRDELKHLLN